ncbi:seminal metalloprotease 1-like [Condylostylus longicornis]|uniref:seminal metalloprotease 1-like n=1 Tax=Condylostylus longicornis TaxID=2530218 RepID=UPI00244DFD2C|nr:seminal metalloprotease 1-like [Condylostylus longicornis]
MAKYLFLIFGISAIIAIANTIPVLHQLEEKSKEIDPEEQGGYFEGDMILDQDQLNSILNPKGRHILIGEKYKWKNAIVHYEIDSVFSEQQVTEILKAIKILEQATCIRFYEKTADTIDFIRITGNPTGCHSYIGRKEGEQELNLQLYPVGEGCFILHKIVHEFIHALGFYHQQAASNRDDYVKIIEKNIKEGKEHNFEKHNITTVTDLGVPYDYESVMHYGPTAFSKNGEPTIIPLDPSANIGQRQKLTEKDILKLNLLYCMKD